MQTNCGRRFGGFTTQTWNYSGGYKSDSYAFLFSIDNREYYRINTSSYTSYAINCQYNNNTYGPYFGSDLYLVNKCLTDYSAQCYTNQSYYNYNSKNYALNGSQYFVPIDYEVYEVEL